MPLDVDALRFRRSAVRHAWPGGEALPRRHPPPDNRWQRGDLVDALYLAADEATAWAEWYRHLAEAGIPPNQQMPRDLWTWEVDAQLADVSTAARLSRVGLGVPRPGRRGWPEDQRTGEQLAAEGWAGLIAPSAALPSHSIVCLFRGPDWVGGRRTSPATPAACQRAAGASNPDGDVSCRRIGQPEPPARRRHP